MPSVSTLPVMAVASPQAASSDTAVMSYVSSMIQQRVQLFAAIEQFAVSEYQLINQVIAQVGYSFQQQVDRLLGINPNPPNPSPNTAVTQPSSDSGAGRGNSSGAGSGTGAMTSGHNTVNQALNNTKQQSGSGSGSGSSATSTHENAAVQGSLKVHPLTGSGGSGVSGSGTGSVGSGAGSYGYGYVSGKVWLDNNGDGVQDNGESGFSGATVQLFLTSTSPWTLVQTTTTGSDGSYTFQPVPQGPKPDPFLVHVVFPAYMTDTYPTADNMLNNFGNSSIFQLGEGGWRKIKAGLLSMNVTTTEDDPYSPIGNQITLRDAIQTGNNGGGPTGLHTVTFFSQGQPLSGTITLEEALDPIQRSYDIVGSGASTLAVSGENEFGVFAVNAGITSTIYGLTIENGSNGNGAGVNNSGNTVLMGDTIAGNTSGGNGGGIDNGNGSLRLTGDQILGNTATAQGGGLYNAGGTVTITGGTVIKGNKALSGRGGGIYNAPGGNVKASGGTVITTNSSGASGGGVSNSGLFLMTGGQISNNSAQIVGGGAYNPGSMRLIGVQVQRNSAVNGGGIYTSGKLTMGQNTNISGFNTASSYGGGVYVNGGTAIMVGGGVTSNTAGLSGGGIYVYSGQLTLQSGVRVSGNGAGTGDSEGYGGGTYINDGKVTVSGGTIGGSGGTKGWGNRAARSGGGIFTSGGTLTLEESVKILGNLANNQGGGIYLAAPFSTTTFNVVTVSGNFTNGNQNTTGWGVYWQNGATVNPNPPGPPNNSLTDNDDPGKNPVKGP